MKIYTEISLEEFEAWSGAVDTLERIRNAGKCDLLESVLEDAYPDGMDETQLNDILWFEDEWCYEMCGLRTESEIRQEIEEAEERIAELREEFESEAEELREEYENAKDAEDAVDDLWRGVYADEIEELEDEIKELEEELENI